MSKMKTKGTPNEMDIHVGQRIKVRRSLLGLSQEKLAESVGVTFQQIQKYERGTNRVSAGRLFELSKILDVPVNFFFEQFGKAKGGQAIPGMSDNEQDGFEHGDIMTRKETTDLLRVYYSVQDENARKDIMKFIKSMAERLSK
ncbi:MAG: helix-turn-helix transcriptional regulator [Alphaproteobacteria bacterium]|nr:helix-turn-helix transcriptional regulator [Alphaproteobacteria bacterium]